MEAIIAWLLAEAWPYILGALAVVGAIFGYGRHQRKEGRRDAQQAALQAASKMRERAREVGDETASMSDSDINAELKRDWVRGRSGR